MATFVPPKKNTQYVFYVSLVSQANTKLFQVNPTLATGDVKVSTDGGSFANLGTLPTVTPSSSTSVKVTLATGEMNGDNVLVVFSDAAGSEWCDLAISLQTVARQVEDLAFPNTSGRGMTVDANGRVQALVDVQKNVALNNFLFVMTDSVNHAPMTGLVDASFLLKKESIDGAATATLSGTITEVSAANLPGFYKINFTAGELNGDVIGLQFLATGSDYTPLTIKTSA